MANGTNGSSEEARLRRRLRIAGFATIITLLGFSLCVDAYGRLRLGPDFHIDSLIFGGLLGSLILLTGEASISGVRLPGGWELRRQQPTVGAFTIDNSLTLTQVSAWFTADAIIGIHRGHRKSARL